MWRTQVAIMLLIFQCAAFQQLQAGQSVLINGFGIGTDHFGGFSEKASVCSDWLMPLPCGLTQLDAAKIGTAGYTAMLCVDAIKQGVYRNMCQALMIGEPSKLSLTTIKHVSFLNISRTMGYLSLPTIWQMRLTQAHAMLKCYVFKPYFI